MVKAAVVHKLGKCSCGKRDHLFLVYFRRAGQHLYKEWRCPACTDRILEVAQMQNRAIPHIIIRKKKKG